MFLRSTVIRGYFEPLSCDSCLVLGCFKAVEAIDRDVQSGVLYSALLEGLLAFALWPRGRIREGLRNDCRQSSPSHAPPTKPRPPRKKCRIILGRAHPDGHRIVLRRGARRIPLAGRAAKSRRPHDEPGGEFLGPRWLTETSVADFHLDQF